MKCPNPNCGVENREGASFCRACGTRLAPQATNIMDKFPDYNFVPTNLIDWKKPWLARIVRFVFLIILCISVIKLFICLYAWINPIVDSEKAVAEIKHDDWGDEYYERTSTISCIQETPGDDSVLLLDTTKNVWRQYVKVTDPFRKHLYYYRESSYSMSYYKEHEEGIIKNTISYYRYNYFIVPIVIFFILLLISVLIIVLYKRVFPNKNTNPRSLADYIQKYQYTGLIRGRKKPILKFFVKDNKMGLMDVAHYCVFLPAQYDVLEWREKNKYLNATVGNRTFIIDINGNELK